jgi:hypothetical protein
MATNEKWIIINYYEADMSTVCTGANRGASRYLTENCLGLGVFTQVSNGCVRA